MHECAEQIPVWDHSTFSFHRDRLFDDTIAQAFFGHTVLLARVNDLVSEKISKKQRK
ncbi:hypothetical protein [Dyella sp. M7H15-1]|uniref:hypothetical protein n=1 Tax=Dyella sp. M7H15-1 TaxID=2501295 RepID=UPI00197AAC45|nr:hypothetical protein [Dyella sp. M7H15-1]